MKDILDLSRDFPETFTVTLPGGEEVDVDTIDIHKTYWEAVRIANEAGYESDDDRPWITEFIKLCKHQFNLPLTPINAYKLATHILTVFSTTVKNSNGSQKQSDSTQ